MKKIFLFTLSVLVSGAIYAQDNSKSREEESSSSVDLGKIKADNNDWKGALNDFANAIAYNPKNGIAYYQSGIAKQNLKEYKAAIVDFSKAIYLNNSVAESYLGRGICYFTIGNKEKCCLDLIKSSELGNSDANQAIQNYCN